MKNYAFRKPLREDTIITYLTLEVAPENDPTNQLSKPSGGPTNGNVGEDYIYTTSSADSDGDNIKIWDWNGDNIIDE